MNKEYRGIDVFRLAAAYLVVAIHTSPLASFSKTGDLVLTRTAGRLAVPFFLMTSGFFLISRYNRDAKRLAAFVKKTMLVYGAAILLYIPINIYNGYFLKEVLFPNIIKDLIFDGTMYHLWYLPAAAVGSVIAWCLVKKCGFKGAFLITLFLYLVGLFGDSYYGVTVRVPALKKCYDLLFQIMDYTRNGFFLAPVFFVMGGLAADQAADRTSLHLKYSIPGLCVTFALMVGEAVMLHVYGICRHDSMYVFLVPCMFFLFQLLLHFRGKRVVRLRFLALLIYLIHPMAIVAVRLTAKLAGISGILVENSMIHFLAVCFSSTVFAAAAEKIRRKAVRKVRRTDVAKERERAFIEIDVNNLEHNVRILKEAMQPGCELMAVLKAEAYGHGAFEISTHLDRIGVRAFAVATVEEGIRLRKYGVRGEILILGYTNPYRAGDLKKYGLMQTLTDLEYAEALNAQGVSVRGHIKIDTGMHRLGLDCQKPEDVMRIFLMKHIKVCGIYTHLCCSDSLNPRDVEFTEGQIERFYDLIGTLRRNKTPIPKLHIQSSYGLLNYPELTCDYARIGISLYGVSESIGENCRRQLDLKPVLSVKARVTLIRRIDKGETFGYGRSFCARRDSRIAMLSIGYGDGIPRNLSEGRGSVIVNGKRVPIVGRICMDQLALDITDVENVSVGDMAALIDTEEDKGLSAPSVAKESESISNELLSRLGARLPVVVKP